MVSELVGCALSAKNDSTNAVKIRIL